MKGSDIEGGNQQGDRTLGEENERLRAALDAATDDNAALSVDRDRLLRRLESLAAAAGDHAGDRLQTAFAALQALTGELESANDDLRRTNDALDARIAARGRQIDKIRTAQRDAETSLRAAIEALQRSERRFRSLIEGIPQLVWRASDGGQWTWSSPQWREYTGQSERQALGAGWLDAFHHDDRAAARAAWRRAPATGRLEIEGRIRHVGGDRFCHFKTRARPVRDDAGAIVEWLGTSTDVDDLLQLQQQQTVLVAELQHRTRNLMAIVQSITARTIGESTTLAEFADNIAHRLGALSRVQGLLSRLGQGDRVSFDELLRDELTSHVDLDRRGVGETLRVEGPAGVPLRSRIVQTLALAIHELAIHAARRGVLTTPGGLDVSWTVIGPADARRLRIDWRERGVPVANDRTIDDGYDRELIERALPYQLGATTEYRVTEEGVRCTIELDVPLALAASEFDAG